MTRKTAFPPEIAPDCRLLILGSLPGDRSIAQARYYAHPGNAFWWLLGEALGEDLPTLPYPDRLARLRAQHVGLWDVIASADRPASLDAGIRSADLRDLKAFVSAFPDLRAVAFNGATAARHGRRQLAGLDRLELIDLPSSSAAYAAMPRAAKRERWMAIGRWIG